MIPRPPLPTLVAGLLLAPAAMLCGAFVAAAGTAEVRALIDAGKYGEAEEAARTLLGEAESAAPADPGAIAGALDLFVEALYRGGRSKQPEALASAERAVTLKEQALGTDHPDLAASLQNLATVLRLRGEPERSQGLLDRALAIKEKQRGPDHPDLINILNALGNLMKERADFDGSTAYYLRALALSEKAYGPEARQVAVVLTNLASNHQERGADLEAVPLHERAVAIMRVVHAGAAHPEVGHVLNGQANALMQLGEYARARTIHEEALAIREATLGPEHQSVAASLNNLAIVMQYQGDLIDARPVLERAVAIWEKGLGTSHPLVAQGYNNLGTLFGRLGEFDQARRRFEAALAVRRERLGPEHPLVAQTLLNLGALLVEVGDDAAAKPLLEDAVAISEKAMGPDSPQAAEARHNLGLLLLKTGDLDAARILLEEALRVRTLVLGPTHPLVAETLSALGDLDRGAGALDSAREKQSRALELREAALGPAHPDVADSRMRLAAVDFDLGRLEEARAEAAAGAAVNQRFLRDTLGALSERESLLLLGKQQRPEVTLFSGLIADDEDRQAWLSACWTWTLGQRGLVLEEMAERRRATQLGSTATVQEAWLRLVEARRLLAATWVRAAETEDVGRYRDLLERATRARESAEVGMARVSAQYREDEQASRASLADIGAALPPGAALVEIVRVPIRARDSRSETAHDVALVLKKDGSTDFADLGPSDAIDGMAAAWRQVLDATAAEPRDEDAGKILQAGSRLRGAAWDPIAARAGNPSTIFLVPDGSFWKFNIVALPAEDGAFLVERGPPIHLLGTARDLLRHDHGNAAGSDPGGRGALLVGAPDFEAPVATRIAGLDPATRQAAFRGPQTACGAVTGRHWRDLPDAEREIAQVGALLRKTGPLTSLSGAAASEERFKMEAPGKRILHVATHGYFLAERCVSMTRENPLLLSGLILAGANSRPAASAGSAPEAVDDGVLTAEEVAALDLRGTDLVVLSACDTGRGEVQVGEGVFGLQRSFAQAGVRSTLMSLWPVPDREARRWMKSFYATLLTGAPVAEASRRASLAALDRLRAAGLPLHPYSWGAFVTMGDWQTMVTPPRQKPAAYQR